MAIYSYDLKGVKDSFADWISNISPEDTFIVSKSKKESTPANRFKWQTDALDKVVYDLTHAANFYDIIEGANAPVTDIIATKATTEMNGITQIFRKTFAISDSALATSVHGRTDELKLQLEKAGKELKNVMEVIFSSKQVKQAPTGTLAARTDGLYAQIAALGVDNPNLPSPTTLPGGVVGDNSVHIATAGSDILPAEFDKVTNALYRSGSTACCIVVNPVNATKINKLMVAQGLIIRQLQSFENYAADPQYDRMSGLEEQCTITDNRGHVWTVCYCRYCPVDVVYFIEPDSLTQRVLREPKATQLGKQGSFELWQLVIEAGLCVSNPYANGVIDLKP